MCRGIAEELSGGMLTDVTRPGDRRAAPVVAVPDMVGCTVPSGIRIASEAGVALAQPDPDGPPLGALAWPHPETFVIRSQSPSAGSRVYQWDSIVVHLKQVVDPTA